MRLIFLIAVLQIIFFQSLFAQRDTAKAKLSGLTLIKDSSVAAPKKDTVKRVSADSTKQAVAKPKHDPRKATLRSAILPGWGQIYNREYWKLPIVYGALAIPAALYVYNNNYYRWTKFAYEAKYLAQVGSDPTKGPTHADSSLLSQINKKVLSRSTGQPLSLDQYQLYRNSFKRNKDYSLLWFLVLWGVNVADATVFAHLKDFNVNDDLTLHVNPTYIPSTNSKGVSLVFSFRNPVRKPLPSF